MPIGSYYIFLFVILASCCKDDSIIDYTKNQNGELIKIPFIWKIPLHEAGIQDSGPSIQGNLVFQEAAIIQTSESKGNLSLTMIDCDNGAKIWSWSDWFNTEAEGASFNSYIFNEDVLHWANGTSNYWLRYSDGSTERRVQRDIVINSVVSLGKEKYLAIGDPTDTLQEFQTKVLYRGDLKSGELEQILIPEFNIENAIGNRIGQVTSVEPIVAESDTLIIVGYQDIFPNWEFISYLGLYNLSTKEWVYNKIELNEKSQKGVLYQPIKLYMDKVYLNVGHFLKCFEYFTGELVWQREFPHDFSFSGFEISEGIMVANCENQRIYGINSENGNLLWEREGAGTSSNLHNRIMNGIAYFSGGSPNRIFAIDIYNGRILWKLDPKEYEGHEGYWKWDLYVVPSLNGDTDKVIACSGSHAYCFEAAGN